MELLSKLQRTERELQEMRAKQEQSDANHPDSDSSTAGKLDEQAKARLQAIAGKIEGVHR